MSDKSKTIPFDQMSIADILNMSNETDSILSSKELETAINRLRGWHEKAKRREEAEMRQRELENQKKEREEMKRKAREAQEKKEAHIREVTCMDLPLDWENVFNSDVRTQGVHVESVPDALVLSLTTLGKVDIEYISSVTGLDYKDVIGTLRGSIYQNPETWDECFYKGWETADEYLSGNLMRKWQAAKDANEKYNGYFSDNLKAIEAVLPPTVATKDIYVTLGSPWVPTDIIDEFIGHMFRRKHEYWYNDENIYAVKHDEITGTWEIPYKTRYGHGVTDTKTYGTDRIEALHILERTLNMKSVSVTDEVQCLTNASGKKRVINKDETVLAIEKQQKMIAEFQKWVWKEEKRKERLETIFENNFSCVRRRIFDGSFLDFPTMSPEIQLYPYQKNAVARILFSPNTLLAHDVGSGKTYVMIAAGMELRRMGLSKKNLYVVPNNIVGQWKDIFLSMYPAAKLLTVEPKSFTPSKRGKTLEKMRDEEFDGIIMAYSCFEQIPLSQKFYTDQLQDGRSYYFVSDIDDDEITAGIIYSGKLSKTKDIRTFFKAVDIAVKDFDIEEITFSNMRNLLRGADCNRYIDDDDEVLEKFDLDRICGRFSRGIEYGENLLNESTCKEDLFAKADELLTADTLTPELHRIYFGKSSSKAFGHPVHYIIETDDINTRKALFRTLLQALFDNKRLQSRRYCFIDFKPGQDFSKLIYDALYKSCVGGAVVVRYLANDDSEDDNYASSEFETIATLCETMLKYRNHVLTVFCLPRECEKSKKVFFDHLGSTGIVEIREELADQTRACDYLKTLAAKNHIRTDKKLLSIPKKDKQYLPGELRAFFEEWYNNKLKNSVFPQYKDLSVCRKEAVKEEAKGSAYDDLTEMIGLTGAKEVINKALNYYKLQRIYKDKGIRQDRPAMHMVFTGNPGTAKTTVARLFARIMKENGLLSKGQLVEVGRCDLVAKYVGWTAKTVQEKFRAAMGGVLFIDEAYSLVEDHGGSFGDEAINTIVQEMENHREDVVVIFAGYPEEMEKFLDKNPGLRSRIAFHVPFSDYDTAELCDIARLIGKSKGVTLTENAIKKLSGVFDEARKQPNFGNGRYVRNIIELSKMNQAARILEMDPEKISEKILTTINEQDIELPPAKKTVQVQKIGFGF